MKINTSNQGHTMETDAILLWERTTQRVSLCCFSLCSLCWQRQGWLTWPSPAQNGLDSTYSEVTKQAWPVLHTEETTKWRSGNSTMSIVASAEEEQKWIWRAKQLRARSLSPVTRGSQLRGTELKCCVLLDSWSTVAPWGAPFGFTFSESNPV